MIDVDVGGNVLRDRLAPLGATDVVELAGGASSLTYAATTPDGPVVVKVAPAGLEPVRNRDVLRQARVLRLLAGTGVPVPAVVWEDAGAPPEVPPLFVMSRVEGTSFEPLFDEGDDDDPEVVGARLHTAARVLRALHDVDPPSDEPAISLAEEVGRWVRLLETVDPALVPGWPDAAERLLADVPAPLDPAIVHGDFRLGNCLSVAAEVRAVVDWEIWSVADPRVDLGWFLLQADPGTYRRPTRYAGLLPAPADLLATYGDVPAVDWFVALASFKSAATWSLIVKHNRRRSRPDPVAEAIAPLLPGLLAHVLPSEARSLSDLPGSAGQI